MKKSLLIFLLLGTSISVFAQATREYKGAVVDKNGNPLPGAKVEATGGAENTVTDADGTFNLEASQWLKSITVTYPGMGKKKKNIKNTPNNLIVKMGSLLSVGALTIQPKVGMNVARYTNYDGAGARIGLVAGAELEWQYAKQFSIAAGVLYSMEGANNNDYGLKIKCNYINIPIVANFYVIKGFAVKAGIQPAFNVSAKLTDEDYSYTLDEVKTFDLSIPVGVSYEFKNFVIDARYNIGLTNIVEFENIKNSVFQFTAGYKLKL